MCLFGAHSGEPDASGSLFKLIGCSEGGANWIRISEIKKKYNIKQSDDYTKEEMEKFKKEHPLQVTKNKIPHFCKQCGRPLSTNADYCQTCIHEFQRKCEWPTRDELKELIRTIPFLQIGKKYNVSDNAVRKWCINYGLPSKKKDIKNISDEEWNNI